MRSMRTCCWMSLCLWAVIAATAHSGEGSPSNLLAYVGGAGNQQLRCVTQLSDGTVLVGGGTEDGPQGLAWLAPEVPRLELAGPAITGASKRQAFVLHLTSDLSRVLRVVKFPGSAAVDVRAIKTTSAPGEPTGVLYLSGLRGGDETAKVKGGYFIARLDGNFVDQAPSKMVWVQNVAAEGSIAQDQPWDVGRDGKVVYAEGNPHSYDWVAVRRLTAEGQPDVVEDWRLHWYQNGDKRGEWFGSPASRCPHGKVVESAIVLKVWGRGDFRSWTKEDYEAKSPDGNGGTKQGRWPYDAFFAGPFDPVNPKDSPRGRGYTGYGWPSTPCGNVGSLVIDRRNNYLYLGGNNKSTLPKNPDFEPHVVAMSDTGKLQWWMRLYREVPPGPGETYQDNVDGRLSTPDQYIDAMAIDYSQPAAKGALVVLARCHGNNVINFWKGNEIKHPDNPGTSFQPHFTGSNGNIHYQWLGRLQLADGQMLHATYIGEYAEGAKVGKQSWPDPNLDGWPMFNSGWPDINTTRCRSQLAVDLAGDIYLCGTGRRPITTKNALMKMPKSNEGESRWCDFVRVYRQDLTTLRYSSIVTGTWDWKTKEGGSGVSLQAACPTAGGLLVVGHSTLDKSGNPGPTDMPVTNRPAWTAAQRSGEMGVIGKLSTAP